MPDENESKIEALLRAAAGKRRAQSGDPFFLHPPDRQRLQREVAERRLAKSSRWSGWFQGRVPTLSWGVATACMLAIAGWLMMDNDQQVAVTSPRGPEPGSSSSPAEPAPMAEAVRLEANPATRQRVTGDKELASSSPQPKTARAVGAVPQAPGADSRGSVQPAAQVASSSTGLTSETMPAGSVMREATSATMRAPGAPAALARDAGTPVTHSMTASENPRTSFGGGPTSTFYFASLARPDEAQPLRDFSLTPAPDGSMQVVDSDGSVYTGRWQGAAAAGLAPDATKEKPLPVRSLQIQRAATVRPEAAPRGSGVVLYTFTATGTNREMNAPVTFEGVVFTHQSNYSRLTPTNVLKRTLLDASDASVSGKVRLPGGKEVRVEASPVRN